MKNLFYLSILFVFLFSCVNSDQEKINKLLKKNDKTSIIEASFLIGELKDTTYIPFLLKDCYDYRITHHMKFYGVSVYQSKMVAMKKISGVAPPLEITYLPDSTVINYYSNLAKSKGYELCNAQK
jgi:hypothetical protein